MNEYLKNYYEKYQYLYSKNKWKVNATILKLIPFMYLTKDTTPDQQNIEDIQKKLKNETSLFSHYRGHMQYQISFLIDSLKTDPKETIQKIMNIEDTLANQGFKKSQYLTISSFILLDEENVEEKTKKSYKLYELMKKEHRFLTSRDDYPIAILLSLSNELESDLIKRMEYFYNNLSGKYFKKGNDLQFLSQILSIFQLAPMKENITKLNELFHNMKKNKLKIARRSYPLIGMLYFLYQNNLPQSINDILELFKEMNSMKGFKWSKEYNTFLSMLLTITKQAKKIDSSLIDTGVNLAIENIIQAQTAAIIAATSAATVAATTSSN
ncbi:MAG: DUF4003 family protein [Thermotogota bacterium]